MTKAATVIETPLEAAVTHTIHIKMVRKSKLKDLVTALETATQFGAPDSAEITVKTRSEGYQKIFSGLEVTWS